VSERTAVYRVYDSTDALLYVGVTKTFGRRWAQHSQAQPWWPEVTRQTVDWFTSRDEALRAESVAIREERPQHNSVPGIAGYGLESSGKTPLRPIRIEGRLWDDFGCTVGPRQRSGLVRDLIRWYLQYPGAELPPRPPRRGS
jgi:predicted GIY-YIG superfamily endonuclease